MDSLRDYIENNPPKGFKAVPRYSVTGDMLEIYFEDKLGLSETISPFVTILYGIEDKTKIVGVKIYGIKELIIDAER